MDKEMILREIKKLARKKRTNTVSRSEFKSETGISEGKILKHFENWTEAVKAAGLTPANTHPDIDRETILQKIRELAQRRKKDTVSRSEFESETGISEWQVLKHFEGWSEAVKAAGLIPANNVRIKDEDLFREMQKVFVEFRGICTQLKFDKLSKYSVFVYRKRFGKWETILLAFKEWLEKSGEQFSYMDKLPNPRQQAPKEQEQQRESEKLLSWESGGGTVYGSFLNFRGLQHAPVNEQGVVLLFGMVCQELGFVVEVVRSGYPDCVAKRRVDHKRDKWESVRIEFEFQSRNFRDQGHRAKDCDVIVCWEHNWPECPLEVIELKTALQSLKA